MAFKARGLDEICLPISPREIKEQRRSQQEPEKYSLKWKKVGGAGEGGINCSQSLPDTYPTTHPALFQWSAVVF